LRRNGGRRQAQKIKSGEKPLNRNQKEKMPQKSLGYVPVEKRLLRGPWRE